MRQLALFALTATLSTGCLPQCGVTVADDAGNAVFDWTCDSIDTIEVIDDADPSTPLWRAWSTDGPLVPPISYGEVDGDGVQQDGPHAPLDGDTFYRVTILDCADDDVGDGDCRTRAWGDATFEWVD